MVNWDNKKYKQECDKLFSRYIRMRDGECKIRGLDNIPCIGGLEAMHIIRRGKLRLRYDVNNGLAGCHNHHSYYTNHPYLLRDLMQKEFSKRYYLIRQNEERLKTYIDWEDTARSLAILVGDLRSSFVNEPC